MEEKLSTRILYFGGKRVTRPKKGLLIWLLLVAGIYLLPWMSRVYFKFDDINLLMILHSPEVKTFFEPHSYQFIPVFQFLYWIQIQLFGVNPQKFFFVSVGIHLVNIFLAYQLIRQLTNKTELAMLAAVLVSFNKSYYPIIFWATMQTNTLATTFSLLSTLLFLKLQRRYSRRDVGIWLLTVVAAGWLYGFGIVLGLALALTAGLFWRKEKAKSTVVIWGVITTMGSGLMAMLASVSQMREKGVGLAGNFSLRQIFNMAYFTAVGASQAIISRFFLPGFLPNIYRPANVAIMILIPVGVTILMLLGITRVIKRDRKNWRTRLMPLFLFASLLITPYGVASVLRSAPGAHKALTERYMYYPFFFFVLMLVYGLFLLQGSSIIKNRLVRLVSLGGLIIIVAGHLLALGLFTELFLLFLV